MTCDAARLRAVLFRVDATPESGLGHLQRCLSLALALRRAGAVSSFLSDGPVEARGRITECGFEALDLGRAAPWSPQDLTHTVAAAARLGVTHMVVDSYYMTADYLARLRDAGCFVAGIDDLAAYPFPCQLVVNGGAHACQLAYRSSGDTRFLLGPRYVLLRPEFWSVPPRAPRSSVRHVLIMVGGADRQNLMPGLLDLVDACPGEFSMTAIIGPFFGHRGDLEAAVTRCRRPVRLVHCPDSVRDLMLDADLAVSAGGQTLYELAATGTPAVAIVIAENQTASVRALAAAGVVRAVYGVDQADFRERARDAIAALLQRPDDRTAMAAAGRELVDGRGAQRVSDALLA